MESVLDFSYVSWGSASLTPGYHPGAPSALQSKAFLKENFKTLCWKILLPKKRTPDSEIRAYLGRY